MSWEAYRWTAKSPSELHQTLGPQGVDHLVRQMLDVCWRETPEADRTLAAVVRSSRQVLDRNLAVWKGIKKPSPAAFFENLGPHAADGFLRQAMVLCWMMLPRSGGRKLGDVGRIITEIYERNIAAWTADEETFSGKKARKPKTAARAVKSSSKKRAVVSGRRAKTGVRRGK